MPNWKDEISKRLAQLRLEPAREAEIVDEIAQDLDDRYEDLLACGLTETEAQRLALAELGDHTSLAQELLPLERQDISDPVVLGGGKNNMFGGLWQDLRYGVRMLSKHHSFTAIAVLTLALGIGANTAIFSLINAMMLRMLPVKEPGQLVLFAVVGPRGTWESFSYPLYELFRDQQGSLAGICAATSEERMQMRSGEPGAGPTTEPVRAEKVSGNFFSVLGVNAALGRTFTSVDDKPGNPLPVAVISHGFWQRRFNHDPAVVGKSILLNDVAFTIIGVAPPNFFGFEVGSRPDVWLPLQMHPEVSSGPFKTALKNPGFGWLQLMGRLLPGVGREQARAQMDAVFQGRLNETAAERGAKWTETERRNHFAQKIVLQAGGTGWNELRKSFRQPLFLLMGAVVLVLLIACANVANLLLARAAARQKEMALRLAVGADRRRLIRQLLIESLMLALLGGALGVLFAHWGTKLLLTYLPTRPDPILIQATPDGRVLGFTLIVTLLTGLIFGLAPALRATRVELITALKDQAGSMSTGVSRLALNKLLVITQVALSLFLLAGAGLFVRSLQKLKNIDTAFVRENLLQFTLDTGQGNDVARLVQIYQQTLERVEALPGVRAASFTFIPLLTGSGWSDALAVEGYAPQPNEDLTFHGMTVGPRFFETMGIPLLLGRDFTSRDTKPAGQQADENIPRVAVINQSLARRFFGADNPLGQRFALASRPQELIEIVGVVKDAKYRNLRSPAPPTFYLPFFQRPSMWRVTFEVRTMTDPSSLVSVLPSVLRAIDPRLQVLGSYTMEQMVDESLAMERFLAQISGFFSVFALLLAALGLYGVLAYAVASRTREIGIRLALGAVPGDVLGLVIKQGMKLVCIGALTGLTAALAASRVLKGLLYEVGTTDPVSFVGVTLLLVLVAMLACWLPARRAARVDPIVALRYE